LAWKKLNTFTMTRGLEGGQCTGFLEKQFAPAYKSRLSTIVARLYLAIEAAAGQLVWDIFLDYHALVIAQVARKVDHAEAAAAKRFFQSVAVEAGAGFQAV